MVLLLQPSLFLPNVPSPSSTSFGGRRKGLLRSCQRRTPVSFSRLCLGMSPSVAVAATLSSSSSEDYVAPASSGCENLLAMDFPYLPNAHQELMSDLLSTLGDHLGPHLLPSSVPSDVRHFQNVSGSSQGAINILLGSPGSPVDFVFESWIHCKLPVGTLNITTLLAFLDSFTDAPHILVEFIQNGPNSLVLLMDLPPRKDVVLHPEYLDLFYQQTLLDKYCQEIDKSVAVTSDVSTSLYVRGFLSPTAISVIIDSEKWEGEGGMEEIMRSKIVDFAKALTKIWLEKCVGDDQRHTVSSTGEQETLMRRDALIKSKAIEIDLTASLPKLFGQNVADKVVNVIREALRV